MKQILQSLKTGSTKVTEVPVPNVSSKSLLIKTSMTLVSFLRPFIGLSISMNKPIYCSIIVLVATLINLLLNLILIPTIGINGAAIATGTAFIFETLLLFYIAKKFIKRNFI